MYNGAVIVFLIELASLFLLFWAVPFGLAKLTVRRFAGRAIRPVDVLLKELPGIVSGLAIGAFAVYTVGISFEEFAVKQVRSLSMKGMEVAGFGPVARCKSRLIVEHRINPITFYEDIRSARNFPSNPTTLEQIYSLADVYYVMGKNKEMSTQEIIDAALTDYCDDLQSRQMWTPGFLF